VQVEHAEAEAEVEGVEDVEAAEERDDDDNDETALNVDDGEEESAGDEGRHTRSDSSSNH